MLDLLSPSVQVTSDSSVCMKLCRVSFALHMQFGFAGVSTEHSNHQPSTWLVICCSSLSLHLLDSMYISIATQQHVVSAVSLWPPLYMLCVLQLCSEVDFKLLVLSCVS